MTPFPDKQIEPDEFIQYKKGYKYQLVRPYYYLTDIHPKKSIIIQYIRLYKRGDLYINQAYACDGPSGTTIDTKNFMRAAFVHDALYQLFRTGHLDLKWREQADKELRKICIEDGMSKVRACYVYFCVRKFAKFAALPKNKKPIIRAPY